METILKMREICKAHHSCYDDCPFHVDHECILGIPPANWSDENLYLIDKALKGEFHCGIEESGGHAYNCNDCPNKCEEYHQWDKEIPASLCGDTVIGKEKQKEYTAHDSAVSILQKYQKIEDIYYHQRGEALENSLRAVIEDGKID